jgi:hypothetical protein
VEGFAVRHDYPIEWKIKEGLKSRHDALTMPRSVPNTKRTLRRCECVGEQECLLVWKPERSFITAPAIVKGEQPAGEDTTGIDRFQFCLGDISS